MSSTDRVATDTTQSPRGVTRRGVLAIGAVGLSAGGLAACAKAPSSGGGGSTSSAGSAGAPLAKLSDIKVGEAISATAPDGTPIILARPSQSTVAAFSAVCTHQGCTVAPVGNQLDCPCHGSVYNATTGEVLIGPALLPLPKVNVTLSGDTIVAG